VEPEASLEPQVLTNGDAAHEEAQPHVEMNGLNGLNGEVEDVNAHLENGVVPDMDSLNAVNGTTELSIQNE